MFKIDTKEKFTVITPDETNLSAIMTEAKVEELTNWLQKTPPHVVLSLKNIGESDAESAEQLAHLQAHFYENNCSFVICEIQEAVAKKLEELDLTDIMNITPTESEAWDIVQMEEVERELFG